MKREKTVETSTDPGGRRLPSDELMTEISTTLISAGDRDIDEAAHSALALIGEQLELDRVAVLEIHHQDRTSRLLSHWLAPGILELAPSMPEEKVPWTLDRLLGGESVQFSDLDELPPEAAVDRQTYERFGTRSLLVIPLRLSGDTMAALFLNRVRAPRIWSDTPIRRLRLLGDVLVATLARGKAHQEVLRSEARLAGVIDIASDAIISIDEAQRIVLFNKGAEKTFGYAAGEVIGKGLDLLIPARYQASHRDHVEAFADAAVPARQMAERQTVFGRRKDGEEFPAEAAISRLEINRPTIFTVILRDISRRVRMADEVRRQREQLAQVGRRSTMGELTAAIAHELNQPLTAIGSNVAAAKRFLAAADPDLKEIREILDDIGSDNLRASEVIRRIRTLLTARETERSPVDLNETVRQVAKLLHGDMMMRNLALELDLDAELPAVVCDSVQVQQVLMNLMLNGCEAMAGTPQDSRKLIVETVTGERGELARVSVVDHGAGLQGTSPEELFAPFYTRKQDGMGMGLAISRSIVEAHGGRIWGCQNPDRGATFHFTLPASRTA